MRIRTQPWADVVEFYSGLVKEHSWPIEPMLALVEFLEPVHDLSRICEYWRMRKKKYPSDITREQFECVRPLLESVRKQTKPRTVDLYEVWCAVLYLLKSGCQWRMLPGEFPKWRTVHSYFAKWNEPDENGVSALERALKKSGWRGPHETGSERLAQLFDRGRAEREE
jgi:transposase